MSIHIADLTPAEGERHLGFGGTRSGKSALEEWMMREVAYSRPWCMQLLIDSKPRFRAETERGAFGRGRRSAAWRYEHWQSGPTVPNSVVCDIWDDKPFANLWKTPGEIVILQGEENSDYQRILKLVREFAAAQIRQRERRVIVDELLDFYQRNSWGIDPKNDVFYRIARAGGERSIGFEGWAHQIAGVPPLLIKMASRVTVFHLRHDGDMMKLRQFGIKDLESPSGNYVFRQWSVLPGGTVSDPVTGRANYPDSYLRQLSKT